MINIRIFTDYNVNSSVPNIVYVQVLAACFKNARNKRVVLSINTTGTELARIEHIFDLPPAPLSLRAAEIDPEGLSSKWRWIDSAL